MSHPILYELTNPSDPYTFYAPSLLVAAAATLLVGRGKYAAHRVERGEGAEINSKLDVPFFFFGGHDEWFAEQGGGDLAEFVKAHRKEIAACLESFFIGSASNRRAVDRALLAVRSDVDRDNARREYHDEHRSSMNNIGEYAWQLAQQLRESSEEQTLQEQAHERS